MTLPEGWRMAPLEDLAQRTARAIVDGPFGSNLARQHYTADGPRVVRLQNIGDGQFLHAEAHISKAHFETLRRHEVLPGDLLIASLGEPVLRACIAPDDLGPAIVKADCIRVRLGADVEPKWVLYALQSDELKRWAARHSHGVGRMRLGLNVIRGIPIPLPSISEQRRVLALLEERLSSLEAADASLVRNQRRLLTQRAAVTERLLRAEDPPERPIGELLREPLRNGYSARAAQNGSTRVVTLTAITRNEFSDEYTKLTDADAARVRGLWLEPGDILVERSNTPDLVGTAALYNGAPDWAIFPDLAIRVRVNPALASAEYLALSLRSVRTRRYFTSRARGLSGSMPKIDQGTIAGALVPVPSLDRQVQIMEAADEQHAAIDMLSSGIRAARDRSAALRRALLQAAFDGRLTGHASDIDRAGELAFA